MKQNVGIIHPGMMGIYVAAAIQNSGHSVYWVSEARSRHTRDRAEKYSLYDAETLATLCETCSVIVSVCPPHAAEEVAEKVLAQSFQGIYLDANAITPKKAIRIEQMMKDAGIAFVDGGIVGGPSPDPEKTWLYLSGNHAEEVAPLFSGGPLTPCVIGNNAGKASALKMCYAAYTKGTTALLAAILATAEGLNVRGELETQWSRDWENFGEEAKHRVQRVTAKAWRFVGEMKEIAATFREEGVPGEFHAAAETIYQRIAHFKDATSLPPIEEVLDAMIQL